MALGYSFWEQLDRETKRGVIRCQVNCHTTDASIAAFARDCPGATLFSEEDGQTITDYDPAPGFVVGDLDDDAAPAVIGFILGVEDAEELIGLGLVPGSIVNGGTLAMTALVPTRAGASTTGVSASGNICCTLSLTGLDADSEIATVKFAIEVIYRSTQP